MLFEYVLAALLVAQGCLAFSGRISNGENAKPHQFPYQVSIVWGDPPSIKYQHVCGGSVLNENWVLTAGHCVTELPNFGRMGVHVGKLVINVQEPGQQFSNVSEKFVHHSYLGGPSQHDIALLRLETPLILNDIVSPVKLPPTGKVHTGEVVLSGWGWVSENPSPVRPTVLQTAKMPLLDSESCAEEWKNVSGHPEISDTQVCTGTLGGSVSACRGDSGSPLVQYNEEEVPEQVGIASWASFPCGDSIRPSVYTRVSVYVDWINHKLQA